MSLSKWCNAMGWPSTPGCSVSTTALSRNPILENSRNTSRASAVACVGVGEDEGLLLDIEDLRCSRFKFGRAEQGFLGQALCRDLAVPFLDFDANGAAAEILCGAECGPAAHERIEDHIARISRGFDAARWDGRRECHRMELSLLLLLARYPPDGGEPNASLIPFPCLAANEPQQPLIEANEHPRVEHHPAAPIPDDLLAQSPPDRPKPDHRMKALTVQPS